MAPDKQCIQKRETKKLTCLDPIAPLNVIVGVEDVVKFVQGKDYLTWLKHMRIDRSGKNT